MTNLAILERVSFAIFVAATDTFVAINMGWAFLTGFWSSLASVIPFVSLLTLSSFLAFATLEDYLRSKRYAAELL